MKTDKVFLFSLLVLATSALAAPVSVDTVKLAAGSWALSDAALGVQHGSSVRDAAAYDVDGKPGFYAVALEGGGTLFLAADDEMGPVIAFTESSNPDLSHGSYLRMMLEKDIAARRGIISVSAASQSVKSVASPGASAVSPVPAVSPAKRLWSALVPSQTATNPKLTMASATPRGTDAISDMRVEPMVKSQWSQTTAGGGKCYNYYTPDNDPCGCTATAAAQIMRYYSYPDHPLPAITNACGVDGVTTSLASVGDSRIYDWASMKLVPKSFATETEREAIGRLTYDIGVAVYSSYTASGTGADPQSLGELYQDAYDYASGVMYWNETGWDKGIGGLHTREMRNKIIYANLDAGRPVQLAIYFSGHSVVCDGYGFVTIGDVETEFAHINMGWAGTDDMWYNIPEIDAASSGAHVGDSGTVFEYMGGAQFNIHPTETGDILSGRVVDDGDPVSGATVTAYAAGSSVPLASTTTDAHGIYSFALPGNAAYDIGAASPDGKKSGSADGVYLQATVEDVGGAFTHNVTKESCVGNSWGNDIDIVVPHVRIVGDKAYSNLNAALAAASEMDNPVVEVFGPARLKAPVTITTNIAIRTVPAPSADYPSPTFADCAVSIDEDAITAAGWAIQVADGVRVAFSNVVFATEAAEFPYVNVMAGGQASFAGKIGVGTVAASTDDAFVLSGAVDPVGAGLSVSYPAAAVRFSKFGVYECSAADAASSAPLIFDALDPTLVGSVGGGSDLVWDRVSINPAIAIAYATNDTIGATYYLSIDMLFEDYTNGAEVVFLRDCPASMFTNEVTVTKSATIRSEGPAPFAVTVGKNAGFVVQGDGAELVLTNVVFRRPESSSVNFATVRDGASLALADGAAIADMSLAGAACSVYAESGTVTMLDGSAITNCVATRSATCKSAGVYLEGVGCSFNFMGGLITGCEAGNKSGGGAAYAERNAEVILSGSATAYGNKAYTNVRNIYVPGYDRLVLAGGLAGGDVGVYCYGGTAKGKSFATVSNAVASADAELSCVHFRNDYNSNLFAKLSDDGATLVWDEEPPGPKPVADDPAVAEARLVAGSSTAAYATISNAFEAAGQYDAKIELLKNASLSNSIEVASSVVLDGCGFTLSRSGDFSILVATNTALVATNIVFAGGTGAGRILDVVGGSLRLESGTEIRNVTGSERTMVAPVVVWDGSLVMNPGVRISDCANNYRATPGGALTAGAIAVTGPDASAELLGGTITGCVGSKAGGVTVANGAEVRVCGDLKIRGNKLISGEDSNLVVHDRSRLVLAGFLDGRVGYTEGIYGDTNVFGTVDAAFLASSTPSNLVVSARRFVHDVTDATGKVATNGTEAVLAWSSSVGGSTTVTNVVDGVATVYDVVIVAVDDDEPDIVECAPFAFAAIEEVTPGKWKLTLKPGTEHCLYTLKCSSDLKTWTAVGAPKELSADDISGKALEFFLEVDDSDGKKFWKVEGANGYK